MKADFKIGDLVRHIAGGPVMAVVGMNDSMYATSWHNEQYNNFESGWFMKELLTLV